MLSRISPKACAAIAITLSVAACGSAAENVSRRGSVGALQVSERHPARGPAPIHGVPLGPASGLRLLVAGVPPFVLDIDTGTVTNAQDVPPLQGGVLWIVSVGGKAAVIVAAEVISDASLYAMRASGASVAYLGRGSGVWPSSDRRSVWIQRHVSGSRCTLRQVGLQGEALRTPRAFPCATTSDPSGGSLGLVVNRTRVVSPYTGRLMLRARWGIVAVAGKKLVLNGPARRLTLLDAATGAQRRLRWPSVVGGLDQPAVDPSGRFIALAFGDPAWNGGPQQALDIWLLDTKTAKLTQVPGMPALVSLKRTSMAWTDDGRLVLLAEEGGGRDIVAVWRPGERDLGVATVNLPSDRSRSGSDSFAPIE